uniref:Lymphokine-activated killer T-cell-originated protein kinase-like n=1 Tax=Phallusia mammillata TaxID=59560 RepID=A0A6F9DNR6_9ASCI|nr:lymphokine-activated killer T-cell-originated protein kinase-like [Phallusia mammillata]
MMSRDIEMDGNQLCTPITLKHDRINALKCQQDSPCLRIPASPFMKHLGFGTGVNVYLVERSPKLGQYRSPWAVKKINKKCGHNSSVNEQRLQEEAMILKSLNHRNIVGYRGFSRSVDGTSCLAMESGEKSLMSIIEDRMEKGYGPFPAQTILCVAQQLADALVYLHEEKHLLHGDLKSPNILIRGNFDEVKLCDFGVTVELNDGLTAKNQDAEYVGTESWSSKEVLQGTHISDKADIFAFGMVLYEMLTLGIPHMHVFPEEEDYDDPEEFETDFEEAETVYQESLGSRPPLVNYEFDMSYTPVIELFWACTHERPSARPSARQITQIFEEHIHSPIHGMPDPKGKLEF